MKKNILFIVENVTTAHGARSIYLANAFSPERFNVYFASYDYDHLKNAINQNIRLIPLTYHFNKKDFEHKTSNWKSPVTEDYFLKAMENDLQLLREIKPDVVISDFRFSIPFSARQMGIDSINISNVSWDPDLRIPYKLPFHSWLYILGDFLVRHLSQFFTVFAEQQMLKEVNPTLVKKGFKPYERLGHFYLAGDHVALLDYPFDNDYQIKENQHFIGATFFSIGNVNEVSFKRIEGKKNILVSMGNSGNIKTLLKTIEALPGEHNFLVVTSGRIKLPNKKDNITEVDFYPFDQLHNFDAIISNGGAPSNYAALKSKIPSLMIPSNHDQTKNSGHMEKIGAGLVLESHLISKKTMKNALNSLLDSKEIKEKIINHALKIEKIDSKKGIVDLVDKILGHK